MTLREELEAVLVELARAEAEVRASASRVGCDPHLLVDPMGNSKLAPLLVTRAQVLVALAGLS
ncbi:hypothetical protein [Klenkia brasiliensis]|uniref:Uncharacterized protein n=1 Tax=Klenkia brasiliensis TaxID=333142 RepID=A0A1G7YHU1_9ACTN|nr:hypothetical protein [Klenkia brasiliensis]SDG95795.1 hypothetical protein SAMN05660324_3957 [Klenkia brasiliensis]